MSAGQEGSFCKVEVEIGVSTHFLVDGRGGESGRGRAGAAGGAENVEQSTAAAARSPLKVWNMLKCSLLAE